MVSVWKNEKFVNYLEESYGTKPVSEIAKYLGLSEHSVRCKASAMGITNNQCVVPRIIVKGNVTIHKCI